MTFPKLHIGTVVFLLAMTAPTLHGQDFLKQLEAKLFQKQQDAKSKEQSSPSAPANEPSKEPGATPLEFPSVLEPEGVATPSLLKPKDEAETLELPPPKVDSKAPPKKAAKPAPKAADEPATKTVRPTPSPFLRPATPKGTEKPAPAGGGFLGLTVESMPGGGFGLTVVEVAADSPAWKAGFLNGDKVVGVAGQAVSTADAFADQLARFAPGSPIKFLVDRRGMQKNLIAVLQDRSVAGQIHGARPGTASPLQPDMANNSRPGQAYLGINVSDMSEAYRRQFSIPAYRGASVTEVVPNSPAQAAGLRPGDCIVEIDGKTVQTADVVFDTIMRSKPGQVITISFYRGRQMVTSSVQLISDMEDGNRAPGAIGPEMLTPEYVSSLQSELERVHAELSETQARLQQLEARLQRMESQR